MNEVDVIAVVGACAPERREQAERLAAQTARPLVPADRVSGLSAPVDDAVALLACREAAVIEFPTETAVTTLIGSLADPFGGVRLSELVCVVDAAHILADLFREDDIVRSAPDGRALHVARAHLAVSQLEFASTILVVGWSGLTTPELSSLMALLNHISPRARLRLQRDALRHAAPLGEYRYAPQQDRPGWVALLNGEFRPHMTDPRVSAFRYEQHRPLHPGRLQRLLDERIEPGEFGTVVRSAGFCRLATRPHITARWDHTGRTIAFDPLAVDDDFTEGDELLTFGQDLGFIGLGLDAASLTAALDEASLTDEEFSAGPIAWACLPDPFPAWVVARNPAE
ncbi:GTP-binding protein [Microbacterium album]|uniref:CobW C-terminal domain-containing protein n=1 Tax=Microbacterium album TaxID=2053191 RepID=A0A917IHY2_9MICO|nr:GTP-binding protein [Microbacterium album]GGH50682.1 hypothetical protein GCM10010921_29590 [Microbacterium album]